MTESLLLPLRSSSKQDPLTNSLFSLIEEINQRSSFRQITEESVTEELSNTYSSVVAGDNDDNNNKKEDFQEKRKQLYEKRSDMSAQIAEAHNSALMAVDFISLLLSKSGRKAEQSISPFLKEHVPLGSLSAQLVQQSTDDYAARNISLVSTGWKLQSFNSAAESLLRSATRLEKEISQETKYWEQILAVKEQGWPVCRLPHERHTLGVNYGFREASPAFRDRGLAALRRQEDGKILLDRGPLAPHPRTLRVTINSHGQPTGTSISNHTIGESIEDRILEARSAIYDEELFFELNREARVLINQGVEIRQNVIQFQYDEEKFVHISLEPHEDSAVDSKPENSLAISVALILRLLLSHHHHLNYAERTGLHEPLGLSPRQNPPYSLIRPLLAYIQHSSHLNETVSFLQHLLTPLKSAGLCYDIVKSPFSPTDLSKLDTPDKLIAAMTSTLESTFTITLPSSKKATIILTIQTNLAPQLQQGTEYNLTYTPSFSSAQNDIPHNIARISSGTEVQALTIRMLSLDLVTVVASISRNYISSLKKDGALPNIPAWVPSDYQGAELSRTCSQGGTAKMVIKASEGILTLKWEGINGRVEAGQYTWQGSGGAGAESRKTFADVVNAASL